MKVCVFDFETDSVDPVNCNPVEIAIGIYDTKTKEIIKTGSWLIKPSKDYQLPEHTQQLLNLSNKEYQKKAKPIAKIAKKVFNIISKYKYLVSHNGLNFDMIILERLCTLASESLPKVVPIDTRYHIDFPSSIKTRKLLYLCAEYGFVIKNHHRALADVEALCKLLSFFNFKDIYEEATSKKVTVKADVSYDQRQLAKDCNFQWDKNSRSWIKILSEAALKKEEKDYQFEVEIIDS